MVRDRSPELLPGVRDVAKKILYSKYKSVGKGLKIKGQGPGLVNVLSQREWLRVDQFQYTHG